MDICRMMKSAGFILLCDSNDVLIFSDMSSNVFVTYNKKSHAVNTEVCSDIRWGIESLDVVTIVVAE